MQKSQARDTAPSDEDPGEQEGLLERGDVPCDDWDGDLLLGGRSPDSQQTAPGLDLEPVSVVSAQSPDPKS